MSLTTLLCNLLYSDVYDVRIRDPAPTRRNRPPTACRSGCPVVGDPPTARGPTALVPLDVVIGPVLGGTARSVRDLLLRRLVPQTRYEPACGLGPVQDRTAGPHPRDQPAADPAAAQDRRRSRRGTRARHRAPGRAAGPAGGRAHLLP